MDLIDSFSISDSTKDNVTIVEDADSAPQWLKNVYEQDNKSNQSNNSSHFANIVITIGSKRRQSQSLNTEHNKQVEIKITKREKTDKEVEKIDDTEKNKMQPDQMVSVTSESLEEIFSTDTSKTEFDTYRGKPKNDDQSNFTNKNENSKPEVQLNYSNGEVSNDTIKIIANEVLVEQNKTAISFPRIKTTCLREVKKFPGKVAAIQKQLTMNNTPIQNNSVLGSNNNTSTGLTNSVLNSHVMPTTSINTNGNIESRHNDKLISMSSRITGMIKIIAKNLVMILPRLHNYVSIKNIPDAQVNYAENAWKKLESIKCQYFELSYKLTVYLIEQLKYKVNFKQHLNYWVIEFAKKESVYYSFSYFDVLVSDLLQWTERRRMQEIKSYEIPLNTATQKVGNSITAPNNHPVSNNHPAPVTCSIPNVWQNNVNISQPRCFQSHVPALSQRLTCMQQTQPVLPSYHMPDQLNQESSYQQQLFAQQQQEIQRELENQNNVNINVTNETLQANYPNNITRHFAHNQERSSSRDSGFFSPRSDERTLEQMDHGSAPTTDATVSESPVISFVTSMNPGAAMMPYGKCKMCGTITNLQCLGCNHEYYCNNVCQMEDWSSHQSYCINKQGR